MKGSPVPLDARTKMKICVTIPNMQGAGCERMLSDVLPYYAAAFDVDLVLVENKINFPIPDGVNVISLNNSISEGGLFTKLKSALSTIFRLRALIRRSGYSAIVSYLDGYNVMVYTAGLFLRKKPLHIVCEQTIDDEFFINSTMSGWKQRVLKFAVKTVYDKVDHVIAVSQNVRKYLVEDLGIKNAITVIYNGYDTGRFNLYAHKETAPLNQHFAGARIKLLCISRLYFQKNIPFLLDSFDLAKDKIPDADLFILGTGPLERTVEDKIDLLNLSDRVFLLGFCKNPEDYLKRSDAFLLASRYESFGNVVVEALACGVPVVTTNYGAVIKEVMPSGDLGHIIEQGDIQAFADAIVDVLKNRSNYEPAAMNEYAVSKFDVSLKAAEYVNTVKSVIDSQSKS